MRKSIHLHQLLVSNEIGGAGRIGLTLAKFFADQLYQSHVWIPGTGAMQNMALQLGLVNHIYNPKNALSAPLIRAVLGNFQVWRRLYLRGPGIVHVYSPLYYRALRYALKGSGLKTVLHIQIEEDRNSLAADLRWPPDAIITCANFLVDRVRRALPERYRHRQRICAIQNAVDTTKFMPGNKRTAKQEVGVNPEVPLLLMVANLAPHKGQETALRAIACLRNWGVATNLWLAGVERGGGKNYTNYLQRLCEGLRIGEQVRFLGQRNDIPQLLRAADLFLLPSTAEGLPLSVLEAQATKVPVLAAPTAGIPEIIDDAKTGFLIPASDADQYARRIKELLDASDMYHNVAERAYRNVTKNYDWRHYCEQVSRLYDSLACD